MSPTQHRTYPVRTQSATPQSLDPALKSLEQPHLLVRSVEAASCRAEELAGPYTNMHLSPNDALRYTSETALISVELPRQIRAQTSLDYQ